MTSFITFEGIEGCGKTTQMRLAGEHLEKLEIQHILTEEPGGSPLGKRIRKILLNEEPYRIGARAELLLFAAARAQHVEEVKSLGSPARITVSRGDGWSLAVAAQLQRVNPDVIIEWK